MPVTRPQQLWPESRGALTLGDLLYVQRRLNTAMGDPCGQGEEGLKAHALALLDEVFEALRHVNWKPWKPKPHAIDREKLLLELVDVGAFWLNMLNAMGYSEEEVTTALIAKWRVNFDRVDDGEVTRGH